METTFVLDDGAKTQMGEELVPQIVGTDGVTYRVVVAQGDGEAGQEGASLQIVGSNDLSFQNSELPTVASPIYVMMNEPTEIPGNQQRIIVPTAKSEQGPRVPKSAARNEKRRATHNEVERRRRDKINLWIGKLGRIIPECQDADPTPSVVLKTQSKGGILSKACNYIAELKKKAEDAEALAKELQTEMEGYRHKFEVVSQENAVFREALAQAGLHINVLRTDLKIQPLQMASTEQHVTNFPNVL